MKLFSTRSEVSSTLDSEKGNIGFVPTMGALHSGHISLVDCARKECDRVVVSIFVNPTQFNDPTDLTNYPRTLEADLSLLEKAGVDYVYAPSVEDIYPEPDTRIFDFGTLDKVMEGAHRPGHFNGVGQVVSRLFQIVRPDRAYFGEKDFQQLAIIREMVRQEKFPITIVGCPIVRAEDGLALSSRNTLLTPEHRDSAPLIYQALREGARRAEARTLRVEEVRMLVTAMVNQSRLLKVEYFNIVDATTLEELSTWSDRPMRGCIAVHAGAIRLIDNIEIV